MNVKQLETKFSRHIGRIMNKFDSLDYDDYNSLYDVPDVKEFTKGELWLLCKDLVLMLGMNEGNQDDTRNYTE